MKVSLNIIQKRFIQSNAHDVYTVIEIRYYEKGYDYLFLLLSFARSFARHKICTRGRIKEYFFLRYLSLETPLIYLA